MGIYRVATDKGFAPLDGNLLSLIVLCLTRSGNIWNLVTSIVKNSFSFGTPDDEVCMKEVHD